MTGVEAVGRHLRRYAMLLAYCALREDVMLRAGHLDQHVALNRRMHSGVKASTTPILCPPKPMMKRQGALRQPVLNESGSCALHGASPTT